MSATKKKITPDERLAKLEAKREKLEQQRAILVSRERTLRAKAMNENRKKEEAVKYALGGLVLKLMREKKGFVLNDVFIDEIVDMLPEAQREKAREMLHNAWGYTPEEPVTTASDSYAETLEEKVELIQLTEEPVTPVEDDKYSTNPLYAELLEETTTQ